MLDAEGAYVTDSETRSGRRYEAMRQMQLEAEGDVAATKYLKRKPRRMQRKSTLIGSVPHSDLDGMVVEEIVESGDEDGGDAAVEVGTGAGAAMAEQGLR